MSKYLIYLSLYLLLKGKESVSLIYDLTMESGPLSGVSISQYLNLIEPSTNRRNRIFQKFSVSTNVIM